MDTSAFAAPDTHTETDVLIRLSEDLQLPARILFEFHQTYHH